MRILITFLIFLPSFLHAQKYPRCNYTYFKNGNISTSQCFDTDNRWGKAKAFNNKGDVVYEKELRRIAGHSSVTFTFYETGAVKKAEWSSAPDGGIQWYRSYTWFDESGTVTKEEHNNWDDNHITVTPGTHPVRSPSPLPAPKPKPVKQETAECAEVWASEYWIVNTAPYNVVVTFARKGNVSETQSIILKPRQSVKAGSLPGAQIFYNPSEYYEFKAQPATSRSKRRLIVVPSEKRPENLSRTVRRYFFDVRRII